jgi:putative FmdB family regulatory protein
VAGKEECGVEPRCDLSDSTYVDLPSLLLGVLMPNYEYACSACEHQFEVYQGVKDPVKRKCPKCKKLRLERLIFPVMGQVKSIKTLGQLAEKNTKKAGSSMQSAEEDRKIAAKAEIKEINKINNMTEKQKIKYIEGK